MRRSRRRGITLIEIMILMGFLALTTLMVGLVLTQKEQIEDLRR